MGVTISNQNHSIDLGMGGYHNLCNTIAKCLDEEFYNVYIQLLSGYYKYSDYGFKSQKEFFDDHDKKVIEICNRKQLDEEVVNFLYRPDCSNESVKPKTCRHIWKYIKDYDDNILYGYCGRPDCARFKDFKKIVEECAKKRWVMKFS